MEPVYETTDWEGTLANINKVIESVDKADEAMHTTRANILLELGRVEDAVADCE